MDKDKELYDLSKEVFNEEIERYFRADDRATKYLGWLTFFIGALGFLIKWVISDMIPPKNCIACISVILTILVFFASVISWYLAFYVSKQKKLRKIPINEPMQRLFEKDSQTIYRSLVLSIESAMLENREITDRKFKLLTYSYNSILVAMSLFVMLAISIGIYLWHSKIN